MDVQAKVTSKGQVTLPKSVREALRLSEGDHVIFRVLEGRAVLAKVPDFLDLAGSIATGPAGKGDSLERMKTVTWRRRSATRR